MINGVEIINQTAITEQSMLSWVHITYVMVGIVVAVLLFVGLSLLVDNVKVAITLIVLDVIIFVVSLHIIENTEPKYEEIATGKYRYEAVVEDSALRELISKYSVIEVKEDGIVVFEDK